MAISIDKDRTNFMMSDTGLLRLALSCYKRLHPIAYLSRRTDFTREELIDFLEHEVGLVFKNIVDSEFHLYRLVSYTPVSRISTKKLFTLIARFFLADGDRYVCFIDDNGTRRYGLLNAHRRLYDGQSLSPAFKDKVHFTCKTPVPLFAHISLDIRRQYDKYDYSYQLDTIDFRERNVASEVVIVYNNTTITLTWDEDTEVFTSVTLEGNQKESDYWLALAVLEDFYNLSRSDVD